MAGLDFLNQEIAQLKADGLFRANRVLSGPQGARAVIDGHEVVNLSSNDYLGLANDPRLKEAAIEGVRKWGAGTAAVRTIIGTMTIHQELEEQLARFKHTPAAIVFQSGFTCNSGVVPAIVGEGDVIISDELNHASIIDGARLSKAAIVRYRHRDMDDLEAKLQAAAGSRRRLVATDGVFSMDGDIAPLPQIVALCQRYDAISYVDDAHASGVLGEAGRGSVNHFHLDGQVDIQVGTLSKAVGVLGGYVASTQNVIDWLVHRGRPFLFSTSHPPAVTMACIQALKIMEEEPERHRRLWSNTAYFKGKLQALGFDCGHSETPITPVMVGEGSRAMEMSDRLMAEGVFAQGIAYPTVAKDKGRLRAIVTAGHSEHDLDQAVAALGKVGREMGLIV